MMRTALWVLFAFLCVAIGLYPVIYLVADPHFGLLTTKSDALLASALWNAGFYTHIIFGGLALLSGWSQFSARLRHRRISLHRNLGKIYVVSVLLSGAAGVGIGAQATGGVVAGAGFMSLGIIWLYTTISAYRHIRTGRVDEHRKMMVYSYAACFAAVTLRLWMPILIPLLGDFIPAYRLVAWLCWVPNLAVAWFYNTSIARSRSSHSQSGSSRPM